MKKLKPKPKTISLKEFGKRFTAADREIIEQQKKYYYLALALRKTRQAKGLTQDKLAQKAHLPRTTITKVESGERNVTLQTLMNLAEAMDKKLEVHLV